MKKEINKYIIILLSIISIILLGILLYLQIGNNKNQTQEAQLSSKIIDEMDYIDSIAITMLNKLNNIEIQRYKVYTKTINEESNSGDVDSSSTNKNSQGGESGGSSNNSGNSNSSSSSSSSSNNSDGSNSSNSKSNLSISQASEISSLVNSNYNQISWNNISYLYENIYSSWATINLDLKKQGINTEIISAFNVDLDGIAQSIKAQDKNSCLINIYNLYSQIPKYISLVSKNQSLNALYNTKLAILNAYVLSNQDKWKDMSSSVESAKQYFSSITDSIEDSDNKKKNFEETYILIENLKRGIDLNDKDIFFMQYKSVIQELETIEI